MLPKMCPKLPWRFNIHIFEFLLIAALALVVFGPERLPEVGRFVGKQVARFLAWQQQSPELRLINDVRSEFEREIASLRDELLRTRNQLDVSQDVEKLRSELRPMLNLQLDADLRPPQAAPTTPANPGETPAASPDTGTADASAPGLEHGGAAAPATTRARLPSLRASMRCGSGQACTSARPTSTACII